MAWCPTCSQEINDRALISSTVTTERCPKCRDVIRKSDHFSVTNVAAITLGEVATIDTWLDNYGNDIVKPVVKRPLSNNTNGKVIWSIPTTYRFACECVYQESAHGIIQIRMITREKSEQALEGDRLGKIVTSDGLQPFGERMGGFDLDEELSDAIWGVVQFAGIDTLNTPFLNAVIKRLGDSMERAVSELG